MSRPLLKGVFGVPVIKSVFEKGIPARREA